MEAGGNGAGEMALPRRRWYRERWAAWLWMLAGWVGTPFVIAAYTKPWWINHPNTRDVQDTVARIVFKSEAFLPSVETPLSDASKAFGQFCVQRLGAGEFAEMRLEKSGGGQKPIIWRAVGTGQTQCILMPSGEYKLSGRMGSAWFGERLGFGWGGRTFMLDNEVWFHGGDTHIADLIAIL